MFVSIVGEKDEVSIHEVALMITEAMDFKGEVIVSNLCKMMNSRLNVHSDWFEVPVPFMSLNIRAY